MRSGGEREDPGRGNGGAMGREGGEEEEVVVVVDVVVGGGGDVGREQDEELGVGLESRRVVAGYGGGGGGRRRRRKKRRRGVGIGRGDVVIRHGQPRLESSEDEGRA